MLSMANNDADADVDVVEEIGCSNGTPLTGPSKLLKIGFKVELFSFDDAGKGKLKLFWQ